MKTITLETVAKITEQLALGKDLPCLAEKMGYDLQKLTTAIRAVTGIDVSTIGSMENLGKEDQEKIHTYLCAAGIDLPKEKPMHLLGEGVAIQYLERLAAGEDPKMAAEDMGIPLLELKYTIKRAGGMWFYKGRRVPDKALLAADIVANGATLEQAGTALGVTKQAVSLWIKKVGGSSKHPRGEREI